MGGKKNVPVLRCHLILKVIFLPRQARDKHSTRESSPKSVPFVSLRWTTQDSTSLVPGDVISLGPGDIPCDCMILSGVAGCDESMLTGASESHALVFGCDISRFTPDHMPRQAQDKQTERKLPKKECDFDRGEHARAEGGPAATRHSGTAAGRQHQPTVRKRAFGAIYI